MKVVLFCGGRGMRLREYSDTTPKPLVGVGDRPIMWNLMRYYAHYGHRDFILCLGYRGAAIKDYFLNYQEALSNDFVLSAGGQKIDLLQRDIDDWRITFVDTGLNSCIGERLMAVREYVEDEEMFLANYSDGLSDLPLDKHIDAFVRSGKVASFVSVPVPHTFHMVEMGEGSLVRDLTPVSDSNVRINAGFFVLKSEIFHYMRQGEELVIEPFQRLIAEQKLIAYPYDGFWRSMDTFKDKQSLDELAAGGEAPWQVWKKQVWKKKESP